MIGVLNQTQPAMLPLPHVPLTTGAMSTLLLFVITAALLPASASAKSDSQLWTGGTVNVKLNDHWRLSEEVVARFSDNRNGLYEVELNTLLGYRLSKVTTLWAGYTHDPQYADGDFRIMEQAPEQATFDNFAKIGPGKLTGRLRLEQRWRSGLTEPPGASGLTSKYSIPLKGKTALNLSNKTSSTSIARRSRPPSRSIACATSFRFQRRSRKI